MLQVAVFIGYASGKARLFPEGRSVKTEGAASAGGACASHRTERSFVTGAGRRRAAGRQAHNRRCSLLASKKQAYGIGISLFLFYWNKAGIRLR